MNEDNTLKKELGAATATSLVVGCVIGAGVFFKPYAIYQATGGAPGMAFSPGCSAASSAFSPR